MTADYLAICKERREDYGIKGAQKLGKLAAGLYDDRTHFIFELLQNTDDALSRRSDSAGPRTVTFNLTGR